MKFFRIVNLWWPFGAHILHVKWSMIRAMYNNANFIYDTNVNVVFPNGDVSYYFEKWSDIPCNDDEIITIEPFDARERSHVPRILTEYVAPGYNTIEDMHSDILRRRVYVPSPMVREHLASHAFLKTIHNLDGKYICMHVRWSDKIQGPDKETDFIPLTVYLDACDEVRMNTGIQTVVVCSDTYEAVSEIKKVNDDPKYGFNVLYDENEIRSKNTSHDSVVQRGNNGRMTFDQLRSEYLACFVNMELLINSASVVGNYDSGFCLVAVQMRNKPDSDKNVNMNKPLFGIHHKF